MDKDPLSYTTLTYAWVILIALWGGIASYIKRFRQTGRDFSIPELVGELVISGFVGLLTFFLCEAAGIDQRISAALIGITSHMGSRAIFLLEMGAKQKLSKVLDINIDDNAD